MSEPRFPTTPRPTPADQIWVPEPPRRTDPADPERVAPSVPVDESYRVHEMRLWPQGPDELPLDLVPMPGEPSDPPSAAFGEGAGTVFFVSGNQAFGRPTTREDNTQSLERLLGRLTIEGETWCPATIQAPDRRWVEQGALLRDIGQDAAREIGRRFGQDVVLRWDAEGLTPVDAREGSDLQPGISVQVRPARLGCPMRGGVEDWCKRYGGPWTSNSRVAALVWESHRAMLLQALGGCSVCHGGPVDWGRPGGAVDLFTPTREGGWHWGTPRLVIEMVDGWPSR